MAKASIRVRVHGVPFSLVAIVLTALIVALIIFYVYNDWTLVAVALLLLMVPNMVSNHEDYRRETSQVISSILRAMQKAGISISPNVVNPSLEKYSLKVS